MVEGVRTLVSGMQLLWQRQEILANNLANLSTTGFKRDDVAPVPAPPRDPAATGTAANLGPPPAQALVQWTDFSQGPIRETGRSLDVALGGSGFFVVATPAGPRYTRAGAFDISRDGYLVTSDGLRVLGERGPIAIGSTRVTVSERGEVRDETRAIDTLRVVDFPRPYHLSKEGSGFFLPADGVAPAPAAGYQVYGGSLEGSNVSSLETMVGMIDILRKYEASQRAIQALEEANRQATGDIGRI